MSDEELTMQGRRNWDSAVYGLEIAAENLGYRNFQQVSDNIYQTEVEFDGHTHQIHISNTNDVWGDIVALLMSENWGEAEAFVAMSAIGELPALGITRVGPWLAVRHSISLPSAQAHAFTNGIQMAAIAASRVTQALAEPARASQRTDSLAKGANVSLSAQTPHLSTVRVGLGWDARTTAGAAFDLDASALACGPDRRVITDQHFVFYNNPRSPEGTIVHTGDNTTGDGDGDDEVIEVNLAATADNITNIVFATSIDDPNSDGLTFGQVHNAFIRVADSATGTELARFDLTEDAATETAMVFGELYRRGDEWKFRAIGQGYASGLAGIAQDYGVNIE